MPGKLHLLAKLGGGEEDQVQVFFKLRFKGHGYLSQAQSRLTSMTASRRARRWA